MLPFTHQVRRLGYAARGQYLISHGVGHVLILGTDAFAAPDLDDTENSFM